MPVDSAIIKKQIISLLNANERDAGSLRLYSTASGDDGFIGAEIDTAIKHAKFAVMETICSTSGCPFRGEFVRLADAPGHGLPLPPHYGTPGIPVITPYDDAPGAAIKPGTRKSVEQIAAYRENPIVLNNKLYSDFDHDEPGEGDAPSPLAGFYAIVEGILYFTGFSAAVPLAQILSDDDEDYIPESKESAIVFLALGKLAKDGTISEKFGEWSARGEQELNLIRMAEIPTPSVKPTIGARDTGTK